MQVGKQYVTPVNAGQKVVGVSPQNSRRTALIIQNTGVNPGLYRFENSVQLDNGDFILLAGEKDVYLIPASCPKERINLFSLLGTTFAIYEGLDG